MLGNTFRGGGTMQSLQEDPLRKLLMETKGPAISGAGDNSIQGISPQ